MIYCMAPYRNVYLNNGIARPCCWYDRSKLNNRVEKLIDIKDVFGKEGFDKSGCWKCQMHEDAGGKSHRMMWNERESGNEIRLENLDIYMGNLCNLACITCSSHNSSKWISEEKKIFGSSYKDKQDEIDVKIDYELVQHVKRIKLAGGEVFLMPHHVDLLNQLIDLDVAKNITLVYIVNNTVDPDQFKKWWQEFKSIEFILSVDGIDEVNDYIRYHSKWEKNVENIEKALRIGKCSVNCVVSRLNVMHLPEILKWWDNRGDIFFRILDYPKRLSVKTLDFDERLKAVELLTDEKFKHIVNILKTSEVIIADNWLEKLNESRGY